MYERRVLRHVSYTRRRRLIPETRRSTGNTICVKLNALPIPSSALRLTSSASVSVRLGAGATGEHQQDDRNQQVDTTQYPRRHQKGLLQPNPDSIPGGEVTER